MGLSTLHSMALFCKLQFWSPIPLWCYGVFLCVLMVQFPSFDCTFVPAAERKAKLSL